MGQTGDALQTEALRRWRTTGGMVAATVEAPTTTALEVQNLEVVYNDVVLVLRGVSLSVPTGRIAALLGANGAGKTTLLRAITGLLDLHRGKITKGSITLDGVPLRGQDAAARVRAGLAQVMEGRRIFAELSVEENLRTGAYTRRDKSEVQASYERVMELFPRLADLRRQTAGYLSGGEQQMLAIGRALMASPKLLLLDEPSLGLAPKIVEQIRDIVVDGQRAGHERAARRAERHHGAVDRTHRLRARARSRRARRTRARAAGRQGHTRVLPGHG